jgi:hypothetical protein
MKVKYSRDFIDRIYDNVMNMRIYGTVKDKRKLRLIINHSFEDTLIIHCKNCEILPERLDLINNGFQNQIEEVNLAKLIKKYPDLKLILFEDSAPIFARHNSYSLKFDKIRGVTVQFVNKNIILIMELSLITEIKYFGNVSDQENFI